MKAPKRRLSGANFVGNTQTQLSETIETYTAPYDVTSSWPRKTTIAFFANFGGIEKLSAGLGLKLENYESVQHRLQFSGIKKGNKISFHRHLKKICF